MLTIFRCPGATDGVLRDEHAPGGDDASEGLRAVSVGTHVDAATRRVLLELPRPGRRQRRFPRLCYPGAQHRLLVVPGRGFGRR